MSALSSLVSEAVDLVVHCSRIGGQVRVSEVVAVEEAQTGPDAVQFTVTELFARAGPDAPLGWTGDLPVRAGRALAEAGYEVRDLLDARHPGAPAIRAVPSPKSGSRPARPAKRADR